MFLFELRWVAGGVGGEGRAERGKQRRGQRDRWGGAEERRVEASCVFSSCLITASLICVYLWICLVCIATVLADGAVGWLLAGIVKYWNSGIYDD